MPERVTDLDRRPSSLADAERLAAIVAASWAIFDRVVAGAPAALRKGPRGGGRDRDKIVAHVVEADWYYSREMGPRIPQPDPTDRAAVEVERAAMLEILRQPSDGSPLAGRKWPVRYAARRVAWHALDHAWEIEDRIDPGDLTSASRSHRCRCGSTVRRRMATIESQDDPGDPVQGDTEVRQGANDRRESPRRQTELRDPHERKREPIARDSPPSRVTTPSRAVTIPNRNSSARARSPPTGNRARSLRRRAALADRRAGRRGPGTTRWRAPPGSRPGQRATAAHVHLSPVHAHDDRDRARVEDDEPQVEEVRSHLERKEGRQEGGNEQERATDDPARAKHPRRGRRGARRVSEPRSGPHVRARMRP